VHPVSFTPCSSASRTPCMPGKAGSRAGWVLIRRPPNAARKGGPTSFMNPARMTRSGRAARQGLGERQIPVCPGRVILDPVRERGHPGPLGAAQCLDAGPVGADRHHVGAVRLIRAGIQQWPAGSCPRPRPEPPGGHACAQGTRTCRHPIGTGPVICPPVPGEPSTPATGQYRQEQPVISTPLQRFKVTRSCDNRVGSSGLPCGPDKAK